VSIGTPIGLILGVSDTLGRSTSVILDFFRSLPVTAVFPLFLILFGVGSETIVAMIFFATVFIVIMHAMYGVRSTPDSRRQMAKSFGATEVQIFLHIRSIEAAGQVLIGARTALSLSLIVAIVSEMFIGSNQGLGQRLYLSYQRQSLDDMYAIVLVVGALGYFANRLFVLVERLFEG
jgi:ABC-type nitrate/sulfonate/bicarbonate transport system permease component